MSDIAYPGLNPLDWHERPYHRSMLMTERNPFPTTGNGKTRSMQIPALYVAPDHPDDEPKGSANNFDPCPVCGRKTIYERTAAGLPMRWVHIDDESPRCTPAN